MPEGDEFLRKIENEKTWNRFKGGLTKPGGTVAPAALKALIDRLLKDG